MALDISTKIEEVTKGIDKMEKILGKGLMQPFNNNNSASRKLMFATQLEQVLPLFNPEVADIMTGYENEFGQYSSSLITSDDEYEVIAKIPKFKENPGHHYIVVFKGKHTNKYTIVERISYNHITESYGYLLNNSKIDSLNVGDGIKKGETIQKSTSFDDYNNRRDGVNARLAYMSPNKTTEDGIIISDRLADKLDAPLIDKVKIIINDNDIPLNLYGDDILYKSFPDIGEEIQNGILCAIRRDRKEESLFTQSFNRLSDIMISDTKYTINGEVIDINVYCNNPEGLPESYYNTQLGKYYDIMIDYQARIVQALRHIVDNPINNCSYELKKLYHNCVRAVSGVKYMNDKVFSNMIIEITVLEHNKITVGDKLTNRYGGKGVISEIRDYRLMPRLDNGEYIDMIANVFSVVNRENPGQLYEVSTTYIGGRIMEVIKEMAYVPGVNYDELLQMYYDYVVEFSPQMAEWVRNKILSEDDQEKALFLDSIVNDSIKLVLEPISESLNLNTLEKIYRKFEWIWNNPYKVTVPIKGSDGQYRFVEARRSLYAGRMYIYRLKQYPKDKFSATSLSATNIRSEPTKSKANKNYKHPYTKTPIRFGEMETGDMQHLDVVDVVQNLMLHSNSPIGRKQTKNLYTEDPFDVHVRLSEDSRNRNVEILNAYLKTLGLKIIFRIVPKKLYTPFTIGDKEDMYCPFEVVDGENNLYKPFVIEDDKGDLYSPMIIAGEDPDDYYTPFNVIKAKIESDDLYTPFTVEKEK